MEIKVVDHAYVKEYIGFCKEVYKNNNEYRDILSTSMKGILMGRAEICNGTVLRPIMVMDRGSIVAVCTFAIVDRMKDTLQLAYFEALAHQEPAIKMMMAYGKNLAKEHGIKKILVGLNLHVNYGLGLLVDGFHEPYSFGSAYNPPYYIDYFKEYAHEEINLASYLTKMKEFDFGMSPRLIQRVKEKYRVRAADFKNIEKDAAIYTHLNNKAFINHKFYYERRIQEDLELLNEFKILLKEENLLFIEYKGTPIGFMLWYPDFNELMKPGEQLGVKTVIKNKLFSHKIKKFKIVEIGILPGFQRNGAVVALFHGCWEIVKDRYELCESGWILEENYASTGLGLRWGDQVHKHYKAFVINL
ncbi:hypothetical protein Amet_3489 [Alkaliphilus metalliredigens QYMF]|uniref:N-acetyltransferase domain-containing protein n=1 Tax=Alkaliphilus metalliredigens (strain QYMF) TaxID=293826 RepID=A6TTU9_ALKMQ|nr:hypothetical protein [Alkaliphilus metalliredigens]ABR49617.1 hypothetical protein Amet_3489 [Alkaliphilus metalliredigens QYMF]